MDIRSSDRPLLVTRSQTDTRCRLIMASQEELGRYYETALELAKKAGAVSCHVVCLSQQSRVRKKDRLRLGGGGAYPLVLRLSEVGSARSHCTASVL